MATAAGALARVAERVLPEIPRSLQGPVAEVAGTVAFIAAPAARAAARSNLRVIAPERRTSVRRVFVNQARQYLEVFTIPRIDKTRFADTVHVDGWEHFTCANALGRGVIFGTAHLGPIALVGQVLMARGFVMTMPAEPTTSELMRAVNRARGTHGLNLVPMHSALVIRRVLRGGGVLGIMADRAVSGVGEWVQLCGRPALLPSAHVALALRTGAPLLPAFAWRADGRLHARIHEPLALLRSGDRSADVREGMRRFAAIFESYLVRYPEQWAMFEPLWER